jgi:hypothetical protein
MAVRAAAQAIFDDRDLWPGSRPLQRVTVTEANAALELVFELGEPPPPAEVHTVTPNSARQLEENIALTITGRNLGSATSVHIAGMMGPGDLTIVDSETITCSFLQALGQPGPTNVEVRSSDRPPAILPDGFTFLPLLRD